MSFDPSYPPDHPPPPGGRPDVPPPGGGYPGVPPGYGPPAGAPAARDRVQLPAIFLIVTGVLNLLGGLLAVGFGLFIQQMPPAQLEKMLREPNPERWAELEKHNYTVADVRNVYVGLGFGEGALALVAAILVIVGGVRMLALKSYGLAVLSSVVAAVPCVSPCACPGVLGMAVGVWALIVLMNPDVRSLFR